jgi:hypothetical protein
MANITIYQTGGTINIYEGTQASTVEMAKDKLLNKLYYARNKQTLGGREGWETLLDLYYSGNYKAMVKFIKACKGKGGKTRNECLECLHIIMKGGSQK